MKKETLNQRIKNLEKEVNELKQITESHRMSKDTFANKKVDLT